MADATCSECDEYYKDPRMLPCLHTFCLQCLEKQESQDTLHCPNCKEMITLSENGISVSHIEGRNFDFFGTRTLHVVDGTIKGMEEFL